MPIARYKQLVDQLASEIREGRLAPGTRLPTHRELAAREGLPRLCLFTPAHAGFYERLGWRAFASAELRGQPVQLMDIEPA